MYFPYRGTQYGFPVQALIRKADLMEHCATEQASQDHLILHPSEIRIHKRMLTIDDPLYFRSLFDHKYGLHHQHNPL